MAWIEEHLGEEVSVADVARAAGLSPFHFHRMFAELAGEPPIAYARARRLTSAARALCGTMRPIVSIALDAGFSCQEAFTRAFRRRFATTPAAFRKHGLGPGADLRERLTAGDLRQREEGMPMRPKFVERPAFHVVGMCGWFESGSGPKEIPALWDRFGPRIGDVPNKVEDFACYGVCFGDNSPAPGTEGDFFYLAAAEVKSLRKIPSDMVGKTIPACSYAVFTHRTGLTGLVDAIRWVWGTWLPKSKRRPAPAPDFERYDERFDPAKNKGIIEYWVPLLP